MSENINHILAGIVRIIEHMISVSEPAWIVLLNAIVLAVAISVIWGRLRMEMRRQAWNNLAEDQRRDKILTVLKEAYDVAEWLYSHISPSVGVEQEMIARQKHKAAVSYATAQLRAAGASRADIRTIPTRIEQVCSATKPDMTRYSVGVRNA